MFAQVLHKLWGFEPGAEVVASRRAEDTRAVELLGAVPRHFDFPDCVYRRSPDGAWLYPQDVSVEPAPADSTLPEQIAEAVALRLLPEDILVCQFGIGGHVDHMLARQAAELLGRPLWYLADIPYLFGHPEELDPLTAGLEELVNPVTEAGLEAWERAIRAYVSQLSTVFEDPARFPDQLRAYWQPRSGISLWRSVGGLVP